MSNRKNKSTSLKKGGSIPPPLPPRKKANIFKIEDAIEPSGPIGNKNFTATCDFCGSIFTPAQLSAGLNINTRSSYCNHQCGTKKNNPRYKSNINLECNSFMKGVFESFVAEAEKAPSINGVKTFDSLYRELKIHIPRLYPEEYLTLLNTIMDFEKKFGKYVDDVLNYDRYQEIAGSGTKPLVTPEDWAAAIRNMNRIISMANDTINIMLNSYIGEKASIDKKAYCKKLKADNCKQPCKVTSTLGIKSCSYQT